MGGRANDWQTLQICQDGAAAILQMHASVSLPNYAPIGIKKIALQRMFQITPRSEICFAQHMYLFFTCFKIGSFVLRIWTATASQRRALNASVQDIRDDCEGESNEAAHEEEVGVVQDVYSARLEASASEDWPQQEIDAHYEFLCDG